MAPRRTKQTANAKSGGNSNGGNPNEKAPASPLSRKHKHRGSAQDSRVQKKQPFLDKAKLEKLLTAAVTASASRATVSGRVVNKPFRFLDLPGEIRNEIYRLTTLDAKQALLVHLPRRATLRPRSAASAPDYAAQLNPPELEPKKVTKKKDKKDDKVVKREWLRPFFALTQVCRLIRDEYRPIYMLAQEIGMDFVKIGTFVECFFPPLSRSISSSYDSTGGTSILTTDSTTPYLGNLTIALSSTLTLEETGPLGTDILPLLDTWANSERIEAGFGRYHDPARSSLPYNADADGEAKDMYRLFGRKVEPGRKCGRMNMKWRVVLRGRWLAEVRVVRQPARGHLDPAEPPDGGPRSPTIPVAPITRNGVTFIPYEPQLPRPYFQVLFKNEFKEEWMTSEDAPIPVNWLEDHGFGRMEHFYVKVGALAR